MIILGHTDRIELKTFETIRMINRDIRIIKIFIDSISEEFFKFKNIFYDYKYLDSIFISSNPDKLKKLDISKKISFLPYPVNKKIDKLKSYNLIKKKKLMFFRVKSRTE